MTISVCSQNMCMLYVYILGTYIPIVNICAAPRWLALEIKSFLWEYGWKYALPIQHCPSICILTINEAALVPTQQKVIFYLGGQYWENISIYLSLLTLIYREDVSKITLSRTNRILFFSLFSLFSFSFFSLFSLHQHIPKANWGSCLTLVDSFSMNLCLF